MSTLESRVRDAFRSSYRGTPRLFRAPGRVNLIGEHTDYNDGFVLPLAIERATWVAAAPRADHVVEVTSLGLGQTVRFDLDAPWDSSRPSWSRYVEGVARVLEAGGVRLRGANLVLTSDVPYGAGLSSSASLEMATGLALLSLSGLPVDGVRLALAGQRAEHDYVGTRCGIMDQYVSALAREGHALLIDCRSLEATPVPLALDRHALVVLDSGVKHTHASSGYNARRSDSERGVALLREVLPEVRALRDVTPDMLEAHASRLPELVLRRCRHVVGEDARTLAAVEALRAGELERVGRLMYESHVSLRDDYEVSCPELDALVEAARSVPGVLGARMTGGGFGGCTVNLVAQEAVDTLIAHTAEHYQRTFGRAPGVLVTRASAGAAELP
ncbi:galactokinase [Archangium lansingense]|uniref:Galactokinase n=1 Tax=Archangium lansingense TaxID=2995310 RepID=A0ABT4AK02_9BACT|nr:galactokinase [Archangium lansinium]MCY1082021.1 galactokinase [Archangium lansinium]